MAKAVQPNSGSVAITYVLLSPTFGMHQYTADLANRLAAPEPNGVHGEWQPRNPTGFMANGKSPINYPGVVLVTTTTVPRDRYSPAVRIETPVTSHGTGFSAEGLDVAGYRRVLSSMDPVGSRGNSHPWTPLGPGAAISHKRSAIVHFTGVHLWNVPLVYALRRRGTPVTHTLHDLAPHSGVRYGGFIRLWNRLIIGSGCHLLVHGRRYREQLLAAGVPAGRITYTPLLHGFLGADHHWPPVGERNGAGEVSVLFFGRVEAYKGADTLLEAWGRLGVGGAKLTIAGPVAQDVTLPPLPPGVELRDRRVMDDEGDKLFRGADLMVLPYRDATQSALVAAAYAYGVPVVVTAVGALPEYVVEGETGWIVPPEDPAALAATLRQALAGPARLVRMGAAGRAWFEARRQEEQVALMDMYRSHITKL
jgi:glycosyltransferase involved in cell wall biosynthesis